jgi:hypothetical protein
LRLRHERIEGSDWYSKREHDETPDGSEGGEVSDDVGKIVQEIIEELEHEEEIERMAKEDAKESDEGESRQKEIQNLLDESIRELEEQEHMEDVDGKEPFEGALENDLDEVRDELNDKYVNEMLSQLEEVTRKDDEVKEKGNEGASSKATETSEAYEDEGTGMVYAMETKSESEWAAQSEVEGKNEAHEHYETIESVDDVVDAPDDQFRNRISKIESPEFEQSETAPSDSIDDTDKLELQRSESHEPLGETKFTTSNEKTTIENLPESENREPGEFTADDTSDSAEQADESDAKYDSEVALETEEAFNVLESDAEPEVDEQESVIESTGDSDVESQSETELEEMIDDKQGSMESFQSEIDDFEEPDIDEKPENEITEHENPSEELVGFVKRVQDILDDEMNEDDNFEYVQDPLTGEMQRVPKILPEYETKEQKRSRKLRNLFAKLTKEERDEFKALVKKQVANADELARDVEQTWKITVEKAELGNRNILLKALANERFYFEESVFNQFLDRLQKKLGYNSRNQLIKHLNAQEYVVSKKVRRFAVMPWTHS